MAFEITFPTRHTDAFADTGLVHAGVLLALTEMAYAAFESHCGLSKPEAVYAVQRATEVVYRSPLGWDEGATILVRTLAATEKGFDQEFEIRSAQDSRQIASFVHHWVWFDTKEKRPLKIPEEAREKLLSG